MDLDRVENKVLSVGGRAKVGSVEVYPYPKLMHFNRACMDKPFLAEKKVNGANIRLVYVPEEDDFVALLRGGLIDKKMTEAAHKFEETFLPFMRENKDKILCVEMLGTKTIANNSPQYFERFGFTKDVVYFVFDIFDNKKESMVSFKEKKALCEKYKLEIVPFMGKYMDYDTLVKDLKKLDEVYEGAVLRDESNKRIYKFRYDANLELFPERKVEDKRKFIIESDHKKIVGHFMQGYEEKELGLNSGIIQEEFKKYQQLLEEMSKTIDKTNVGNKVGEIVNYMLKTIKGHGNFDEEMLAKIEKEFRFLIGNKVGKFLAKK